MAVYIVALQRVTHAPQVIHVKRLNSLTRALKRRPQKLVYPTMKATGNLWLFSDASFTKEGDATKGYSMKGSLVLREGILHDGSKRFHLIDATTQSQRLVGALYV